ncbi:hypothetical protein BZA70DRAFT_185099 [Myxozyma melibiosi]|uniref:pH-response regulator protein palC n=1 Tax=Myxozyma melibiosi TaxID=54550 RepID=A0ABR1F4P3_9ASCO
MSLTFPFPLPTTGAFSYCQCISSSDHYQLLADADVRRAQLRDVLKRAKRKNIQDMLEVVKAIEDYIPFAFTIKEGIESGDLSLDHEIVTSWRPPLVGSHLHMVENQRISAPTISYEVSMTLLTYSLSLLSLAEEAYLVGNSEDKWKQSTAYLLSAQSILIYLSTHPLLIDPAPPLDLQPSTLTPLVNMIAGALHLLVLYKSLPTPDSTAKPPSASLMSRISIFALEKFSAALTLLPQSLKNDALERWIQDAKSYCSALAERYMAVERESKGDVGAAIALCMAGRAELKSGSGSSILKKPSRLSIPKRSSSSTTSSESSQSSSSSASDSGLKTAMKRLRQDLESLETDFRVQNDRLSFQKIPDTKEVKRNWPSGREVVASKGEWTPPASLVDWEGTGEHHESAPGMRRGVSYSGQGQYY